MKRFLVGLLCFVLLGFVTAGAQGGAPDLAGIWQGTLHAGKDLRVVVKITKDNGKYKGDFYSIDQTGTPFPATVVQQGSTVKIGVQRIDAQFEAKLAADGNSMSGNYTQGPTPIVLSFARTAPETAWAIPEPPKKLAAMAKDADPSFEVATIKPSKPDQQGKGFMIRPRQFRTINTSLADMITFVYGLHPAQIVGAPAWVTTEKFDVEATPDGEGQPSGDQFKVMVKKMLADRFQLKFHDDKKELSVYALRVAKTGPKLVKSTADADQGPSLFFRGLGDFPVRNATLQEFCDTMQAAVMDRPVVDETGIKGKWDITLKWTPDESQFASMGVKIPPPSDAANSPPPLFVAIQEQAGLRLEPVKEPAKVFVIDHVAEPSAN